MAHSRLTMDDFSDFKPSTKQRRLFVPHVSDSDDLLWATQVTFLKWGGVVLGSAIHHAAMDGSAVFHFLRTWSAFSRDGDRAMVNLPCHDRSRLCARDPPVVHPDALSIFSPKINLPPQPGPLVNEVVAFTLGKDQLSTLKHISGGDSVSTFSAVSAHLWQCMCLARQLPPDAATQLMFSANVRRIMRPPLPDGYFGNAIINLSVGDNVHAITSRELSYIAQRIRDTHRRVNDELVHSAIDYLELAKRDDERPATGNLPVTVIRVVSWLGMPSYDADFSWGRPLAMFRAEPNRGGFVHLIDSAQGDGSVRIIMSIEAAILSELKRLLYAKFDNMLYSKF
ncbi:putrescine hydroxycinnamoyltransferase 1-like [Triticum aestivum]|nr:putrescine hydroxycinnamoyltransferase 1-like [Triticum aestivum]